MLLELKDVSKRFQGLHAVSGLSMTVRAGTIHGLIGPNGAGKSTVFNLITGVVELSEGEVTFKGTRISGLRPSEICALGIARTFQATTLFREYTVLENLLVASHLGAERGFVATLLNLPRYRRRDAQTKALVATLLKTLKLEAFAHAHLTSVPQREQKALCLGMALATGAELVILDEPLAGLTSRESEDIVATLRTLREVGKTILIIEHDMRAVMGVCDTITVLDHGTRIAEGTPREVQSNAAVIDAYLGAEQDA